ncbi:hypothetical protein Vse01_05950 [Micromonospora sediminimaris]|uniref:Uncharacterized protein n=1 Tax=Micromonospora sediminimaris TaxID=547162 RepID=A0A9W5ULL3_9ACTN|nr:hypothetical protein Vse01_05950 [Micromonospora sediminimaris]
MQVTDGQETATIVRLRHASDPSEAIKGVDPAAPGGAAARRAGVPGRIPLGP